MTERTVKNDFTISHNNKIYQIEDAITNKKVMVEEHIDGTMQITNNGKSVKFRSIQQRPEDKTTKPKRRRKATTYFFTGSSMEKNIWKISSKEK
jgi:hypothetical protein